MNREQAESLLAQLVFDDLQEPVRSQLIEYLKTDPELSEQLGDMRLTAKLLRDAAEAEEAPKLDALHRTTLRMGIEKEPRRKDVLAVIGPYLAKRAVAIVACVAICALLIGIFLPALGSARRASRQMKSTTQARGIVQGMTVYAQDNKGRYPERVSQLVEGGYVSADYLISPDSDIQLPDNFGIFSQRAQSEWLDKNSSFKLLAGGEKAGVIDTQRIVGYMEHADGKGVSVARGDGSASYETGESIREQIAEEERAIVAKSRGRTGDIFSGTVAALESDIHWSDRDKVEAARQRLARKDAESLLKAATEMHKLRELSAVSTPSSGDDRFAGGAYGGYGGAPGGQAGGVGVSERGNTLYARSDGEHGERTRERADEPVTWFFAGTPQSRPGVAGNLNGGRLGLAQEEVDFGVARTSIVNSDPLPAGGVTVTGDSSFGVTAGRETRDIELYSDLSGLKAQAVDKVEGGSSVTAAYGEPMVEELLRYPADRPQLTPGRSSGEKAAKVRSDKLEFVNDNPPQPTAVPVAVDKIDESKLGRVGELLTSAELRSKEDKKESEEAPVMLGDHLVTVLDVQPPARKPRLMPVNPWVMAEADRLSTFALDVDNASYGIARKYINDGFLPPKHTVRMEEFVNNFDYNYPTGQNDRHAFTVHAEAGQSPFNPENVLMKIGVRGKVVGRDQARAAHLVFVIDTSGSMDRNDRLPLVKQSLTMVLEQLSPEDRVSVVTYGTGANLLIENESAQAIQRLKDSVNSLQVGGATNLLAGVKLGYEIAKRHYVSGGVNRVILCSDGVANVGPSEADDLLDQAASYRGQGVTFTSVGFGAGSYDDRILEQLANRGDGGYHFVGSVDQAKRLFVDDLAATRPTIAYDGKIQVDFDPARVQRYRLIGYENRDIADTDFRNDAVDAGEVGSGQSSTALYELELIGPIFAADDQPDIGTVYVRYRDADTGQVREIESRLTNDLIDRRTASNDPRFYLAASAARFAEVLRGSEHVGQTDTDGNLTSVQNIMEIVAAQLPLDEQAAELRDLVTQARGLPRAE